MLSRSAIPFILPGDPSGSGFASAGILAERLSDYNARPLAGVSVGGVLEYVRLILPLRTSGRRLSTPRGNRQDVATRSGEKGGCRRVFITMDTWRVSPPRLVESHATCLSLGQPFSSIHCIAARVSSVAVFRFSLRLIVWR